MGYRAALAILWTTSFVTAMCGGLYLRWWIAIGPTASSKLFELITSQYAPYLGAILGFYFAAQKSDRAAKAKAQSVAFRLAIVMSSLWNVVMLGSILQACLNSNQTEAAIGDIRGILQTIAWVVAPAIGFFFGKPLETPKDVR